MSQTVHSLLTFTLMFRRSLVCAAEVTAILAAGVLAFLFRLDFALPAAYVRPLSIAVVVWMAVKPLAFLALQVDKGSWRHVSVDDMWRLLMANTVGSAVGCAIILHLIPSGFPRSVYILDLLTCTALTAGMRISVRLAAEFWKRGQRRGARRRTIIYGAGEAGLALYRETQNNVTLPYEVVGFVDDNPLKHGLTLHGVKVLGSGTQLPAVVESQAVEIVLIAAPSATAAQMVQILDQCRAAQVAFKTIPGLGEVLENGDLAHQIRDVAVEDLLGRSSVHLEQDRIRTRLQDQVVLVTGAAGSIGSELCRQIARFRPECIVAFDCAETPLFEIDQEMKRGFPQVPFLLEIGNIRDRKRLNEVFERYRPASVYHAAAYKHVPMMEAHCFEAMETNVFGTLHVALAAIANNSRDFVMISSDKAVRPTNVMGVSKRIAELVIRSLQNGNTTFASVRFGNVLGSNGSVVPIFKQQIASGGPVTVTHPEMRRYFMTIPEASQLVLQASTMGRGGEIFVLDMGQPVRILDLARNLILLSGLRPGDDVEIKFTGVRPGEKMYEELHALTEDTLPTHHEKIKAFQGATIPWQRMEYELRELREICAERDSGRLILTLKELVPDYNPSTNLLQRVLAPDTTGYALAATAATAL